MVIKETTLYEKKDRVLTEYGPGEIIMKIVIKIGLLWVLSFAGPVHAEFGKYIDANGVARFTNTLSIEEKNRINNRDRSQKRKYDNIIRQAGNLYGVSYALIKAVIHAESNFNPRAISPKGAQGLMQILPENNAALSISDPFDPQQNIMGGTKYLGRMLSRYPNVSLALAAYNAGPGAVDKYQKIPPYKETRIYIHRVNKLYRYYMQLNDRRF